MRFAPATTSAPPKTIVNPGGADLPGNLIDCRLYDLTSPVPILSQGAHLSRPATASPLPLSARSTRVAVLPLITSEQHLVTQIGDLRPAPRHLVHIEVVEIAVLVFLRRQVEVIADRSPVLRWMRDTKG